MNENLPQHPPVISEWIAHASSLLQKAGITSSRLDAEIILAHTLRKTRTYLHAHGDEPLADRQRDIADARLRLRLERTPIAYIIGHKEFYGRLFKVTPATLIPRPQSENIIDLLKEFMRQPRLLPSVYRLVDVGTGSGCLGITAKCELPELDVTLLDTSRHALMVAGDNAKTLRVEVNLLKSNLLAQYPFHPDIILANLPYVDPTWQRSPETNQEPPEALFADNNGLALIFRLLEEASSRLSPQGLLLLEADPRQHEAIIKQAQSFRFNPVETRGFIVALQQHS